MGETIRKGAAVDDIKEDLSTTLSAAHERKGEWAKAADEFLGQIVTVIDRAGAERDKAQTLAAPLRLALQARDDEADDLILRLYDETYNLIGRPGYDPLWTLLYPGGASAYTEGATSDQPERMELLAMLLRSDIHPDVPKARAIEMADEIEAAAEALRQAVNAVARPATRAAHFEQLRGILARAGQVQLGRLKRHWKSKGKSEADIHQIIPDRPRSRSEGSKGASPAPQADADTAAAADATGGPSSDAADQ